MAITNTTTNYVGRLRDVNIAYKIDPTVFVPQPVDLRFGEVSTYVAGIQKLVNRYIIALFTNLGSQPNFPDFGAEFMSKLYGHNMVNVSEARHIFNFASWKVVNDFQAYQKQNPGLPLDEQINTAVLQSIDTTEDGVSFRVKILSLAGENVEFLVPLPETA